MVTFLNWQNEWRGYLFLGATINIFLITFFKKNLTKAIHWWGLEFSGIALHSSSDNLDCMKKGTA